ncbi:MAG: methyltransferase domain-containing protein [Halobacteriales archaeon]
MSHTEGAIPAGDDPLGRAMLDFQRGGLRGEARYVDGDRTQDGAIEENYFTPREDWAEDTIERFERLAGPVLDVGCGAGQHLLWFRDHGVDALGLDVSPGAVRTAEERLADIPVSGPAAEDEVEPGTVAVREGDLFSLDVDREYGSVLVNGTQLGLAGSMAGVRRTLTDLAGVVEKDGVAQVDGYVASELDADFFGYRPDPRDGVAHRTFHFEYERDVEGDGTDRERLVGPTLHFLLLDPFRLRDATVGTPWSVERVVPRGVYYKAILEKRVPDRGVIERTTKG